MAENELFECVTAQGNGLMKVEESLKRIATALNNQAGGLRKAEQRIQHLEAMVVRLMQTRGLPSGQTQPSTRYVPRAAPRVAPTMRTINAMPQLADSNDETADGDFEFEEEADQ